MKRWLLGMGFFLFFLGVVGYGFSEKIDRIVAIVNGDVITQEELDVFARMALLDAEEEPVLDNPEEMRSYFLERMIEDRLILQEAKRLGLKADARIIDERIRDIRLRAGSERAFQQALKSQGITISELRKKLENQLLIYMVVQKEVKQKAVVSPREVTEYYRAHRDRFSVPESVLIDSIFIEDKDSLGLVESQLAAGEDFEKIAGEYSKRASLGKVSKGQLKKDLENYVFSLSPGEPSRPFAVDNGYYIFLVREKLPPSEKGLNEVKDRVTAMIEYEKSDLALKTWLEDLKDRAYISVRQ